MGRISHQIIYNVRVIGYMKDNPHIRVVTMSLDGRTRRQQIPDHHDNGTI